MKTPISAPPDDLPAVAAVMPLRPVHHTYSYRVPDGASLAVGTVVRIPFGQKKGEVKPTLGVVWEQVNDNKPVPVAKLKDLSVLADWPPLQPSLMRFVKWAADYTMTPVGNFLRMALPIADVSRKTPTESRVSLAEILPQTGKKHTVVRQKILDLLHDRPGLTRGEIHDAVGASPAVVKKMLDEGWLVAHAVTVEEHVAVRQHPEKIILPTYNPDQQIAADTLEKQVREKIFAATLLDGVTGSGKTEVYFAAIRAALTQGQQALVLVPEIALTAQFLQRFTKAFGVAPVAWHSHLTPAQRRKHLKAIVHGEAQVILGARSALFLPYADLGVVIVDEEHDGSYKQEEGVFYNARDLSIKRGQEENFPVILVSATPSLETFNNAQAGRYHWLKLPGRYAAAQMPSIEVADMRQAKIRRTQFLSPVLLEQMKETLERGEQVMLYLNRRGYAPLTLCRACGYRMECPHCSAWMVQHRLHGALMCHHCGNHIVAPKNCPSCQAEDSLAPCGPGVERIEDEVKANFPDKRVAILSSDTLKSMTTLSGVLDKIQNREIDILIGTQIVAKGHHFPMLTLVGIVDADLGLGGGDLRAGERTFQLLHQVSGRAGRGDRPGHVLVQSFMPEHRVIQSMVKGERDSFLAVEAQERQQAGMPPAGRLAGIIVSSRYQDKAENCAMALARSAPKVDGIQVLGPAQAMIFKLRDIYRYRLLVKAAKNKNIQAYIADWLAHAGSHSGARIQIDIDPYSFM